MIFNIASLKTRRLVDVTGCVCENTKHGFTERIGREKWRVKMQ
jgi:hypothetical protein